jgi:hypothetical protein
MFDNAAFAKEFSKGLVTIMHEAIERATMPLRDRIARLEELQQREQQQQQKAKIRAV